MTAARLEPLPQAREAKADLSTTDLVTIVLGVAALVVAIIAAAFAYKAVPPKRALALYVSNTRLINTATQVASGLEISHLIHGKLVDPRILRVGIRNVGRAAVTSDMYDGGQPIVVRIGTRTVEKLSDESSLDGVSVPKHTLDLNEAKLTIGPGAIHTGHA